MQLKRSSPDLSPLPAANDKAIATNRRERRRGHPAWVRESDPGHRRPGGDLLRKIREGWASCRIDPAGEETGLQLKTMGGVLKGLDLNGSQRQPKKYRCRTYTPRGRRGTGLRQKDDGGLTISDLT
jgi:hypothetical protein